MKKAKIFVLLLTLIISFSSVYSYVDQTVYQYFVHALTASGGDAGVKVKNGVTKERTGYLCYLVSEDGKEVKGTHPIFVKSENYDRISGAKDIIKPRNGLYSGKKVERIDDFTIQRPWDVNGENIVVMTNKDNTLTNLFHTAEINEKIQKLVGVDEDIKKDIKDGKIYLVCEIVMNVQFSKLLSNEIDFPPEVVSNAHAKVRETLKGKLLSVSSQQFITWHESEIITVVNEAIGELRNDISLRQGVCKWLQGSSSGEKTYAQLRDFLAEKIYADTLNSVKDNYGKKRELQGEPVEGTVPNLIDYYTSHGYSNPFDRYFQNFACWALYQYENLAGFKAISSEKVGTKISESDVKAYAVSMLITNLNPVPFEPEQPVKPIPSSSDLARDPHGV